MRALHYVDLWPVVLQKIEVDSGESRERIAEIAHHGDGFQKHFRQNDRRSDIQVNAALVKTAHKRAKEAKIAMGGRADRGRVRLRMGVRRIRSHGDVDGDRHGRLIRAR